MPIKSILSHILELFSAERRVVVADWRIHIAYQRIAKEHSFRFPDIYATNRLIRQIRVSGSMAPIEGVIGVYRAVVPYAETLAVSEEAILSEANPSAVLSFFSAFTYHNLTNIVSDDIYATFYAGINRLPLGTSPDEWVDAPEPKKRMPKLIAERNIHWIRTKEEWNFGEMIGYIYGLPAYITDLERTLLDSLRYPDKCGGTLEVFKAWGLASSKMNIDKIIDYIQRFDLTILRQRVGFILEELGVKHQVFDNWAERSVRGSSSRLIANAPFSSQYSKRWNLSLNVPESALAELRTP